jgi:hypothetical protein
MYGGTLGVGRRMPVIQTTGLYFGSTRDTTTTSAIRTVHPKALLFVTSMVPHDCRTDGGSRRGAMLRRQLNRGRDHWVRVQDRNEEGR